MLHGFDPLASRFLADLERIHDKVIRAERQISSGLRVETASDDPQAVMEILRVKTRVDMNTQVQTNLGRVQTQVDSAESAMRQAVAIMERARVLGAQNSGTTAVNRQGMAAEAEQLHARLLALVSTSSEGRFVFGSDDLQAPPYVADSTQPNGVRLVAASRVNSNVVVDENQTSFAVSRTASELFDASGSENAFQALTDLRTALANDSGDDVSAAMPKITAALDLINRELAFYGAAQNRVKDAFDAARKNAVALKTDLSRLQEADLPTAILALNSAGLHQQTALSAHSKVPKASLFDYLG
ncbi:MAG TPA: flagellin [Bryobacteraceae bacterium]|nr:flagellin [Bryobacteraceae bacterium]